MDRSPATFSASAEPAHPQLQKTYKDIQEIFGRLDSYTYLREEDKQDFLWYFQFFLEALRDIDRRVSGGSLTLLDERACHIHPEDGRHELRAALFVGSFDPFQMTHLAMALRYLASADGDAPLVYAVPEGHYNPDKPAKSDYDYRYNLLDMQIGKVFRNLVVPLDIGKGADTIEIFRRFIACMSGFRLRLTHVIGSDVLPYAVKMLPADLAIWRAEAERHKNELDYRLFILKRQCCPPPDEALRALDELGIAYCLDKRELITPSSTDFRTRNAFSIVFPTPEIIRHLEVLFRYRLNRNWSPEVAQS